MTHYIHRPTPEGGETDPRFRGLECLLDSPDYVPSAALELQRHGFERKNRWKLRDIPGSDAPSDELLALARATARGKS